MARCLTSAEGTAIASWTKALGLQLGPRGIRVNAVAVRLLPFIALTPQPGIIYTFAFGLRVVADRTASCRARLRTARTWTASARATRRFSGQRSPARSRRCARTHRIDMR